MLKLCEVLYKNTKVSHAVEKKSTNLEFWNSALPFFYFVCFKETFFLLLFC